MSMGIHERVLQYSNPNIRFLPDPIRYKTNPTRPNRVYGIHRYPTGILLNHQNSYFLNLNTITTAAPFEQEIKFISFLIFTKTFGLRNIIPNFETWSIFAFHFLLKKEMQPTLSTSTIHKLRLEEIYEQEQEESICSPRSKQIRPNGYSNNKHIYTNQRWWWVLGDLMKYCNLDQANHCCTSPGLCLFLSWLLMWGGTGDWTGSIGSLTHPYRHIYILVKRLF